MKKISVVGASGRMGRNIMRIIYEDPDLYLGKGVEFPDSASIGEDIGNLAGIGSIGEPITDSREAAFRDANGVIDFSVPLSTMETLHWARKEKLPLVIGTTGFDAEQKEEIHRSSSEIAILLAPNMSLGVNLLFKLVAAAATALKNQDFDIEIVEAHHRFKQDAPSGTALRIAEILAKETSRDMVRDLRFGREGKHAQREKNEIGIHAIRGGDIVGDHTIYFSALGERLELTHRAHSRDTFATGAVVAIKYLLNRSPGMYTMFDVLGL